MDWLSDLLKHLGLSRSIVGAVFLTAGTLYAGPRYLPSYIDPVPKEWSWALVGALVFSGVLLVFWAAAGIWRLLTHTTGSASKYLNARALTHHEQEVLLAMGANPNTTVNVENIDYERSPVTKLQMMEIMRSLDGKGLVKVNEFDETLCSLTPAGRKRALALTAVLPRGAA